MTGLDILEALSFIDEEALSYPRMDLDFAVDETDKAEQKFLWHERIVRNKMDTYFQSIGITKQDIKRFNLDHESDIVTITFENDTVRRYLSVTDGIEPLMEVGFFLNDSPDRYVNEPLTETSTGVFIEELGARRWKVIGIEIVRNQRLYLLEDEEDAEENIILDKECVIVLTDVTNGFKDVPFNLDSLVASVRE